MRSIYQASRSLLKFQYCFMVKPTKKIYDIVPPKPVESFKAVVLPPGSIHTDSGKKRRPVVPKLFWVFLVLTPIIISSGAIYIKFLEARIELWPTQETWDFNEDIIVAADAGGIAVRDKIMPGQIIEDTQELSQQFPATGKSIKGGKAEGTIRVFNDYNLTQILVANTRFLSDEGKLFKSKARISVQPKSYADVAVQASEPGPEYNINPSTFSLPGLAGSPRYASVYGKSSEAMTGGSEGEVAQVSDQDLEGAKSALAAALEKNAKETVAKKITETQGAVLLSEALRQEVGEIESTVKSGAEVSYFTARGSLASRAFIFNKQDLERLIKEYIIAQLPSEKTLNEKSVALNVSFKDIDWEGKKIIISVLATAKFYQKIDVEGLKRFIAGKGIAEARSYLGGLGSITRAEIKFWPPLGLKIPRDLSKVKITISLD